VAHGRNARYRAAKLINCNGRSSPPVTLDTDIAALSIPETIFLWFQTHLIDILGAFAVLVIGLVLAGLISRSVSKALLRSERFDQTVARFLFNVVKYALWIVVLVTVLTQFGVETTSILAALSGVALAIGLALQGTLTNVAAGVIILVQKPFKVGEAISVGSITAVVQNIGLFTTELKQFDGLFVLVPNSELWNNPIVNFHRHPTRSVRAGRWHRLWRQHGTGAQRTSGFGRGGRAGAGGSRSAGLRGIAG